MIKKNIYYFSNEGGVSCYGHFFFAVLIPLIYYDIKTKSKYIYVLKINIDNLSKILKFIFNDRIEIDYISDKMVIHDKFEYYDLYINLLKNKSDDNKLLTAYDIFNDFTFIVKDYNHEQYKKLKKLYIDYHYYRNINDKPNNYNFIKKEYIENKTRYKQLDITNKYIKLKKIRPYIITFFDSKIQKKTPEIVLIQRKIPNTKILSNISSTCGGERRFILNHNELKEKLEKIYNENFINVILEDCNIYEQFSIFRNAKVIIGQHGSGLINIFFSDSIKLIELAPKNPSILIYNGFENLSKFCKFNYVRIKYDQITKKELIKLNKKYHLFDDNDIKNLDKNIKEYDKQENIYNISSLIYFVKTSGSNVDVKKVIETINLI